LGSIIGANRAAGGVREVSIFQFPLILEFDSKMETKLVGVRSKESTEGLEWNGESRIVGSGSIGGVVDGTEALASYAGGSDLTGSYVA